MPDLVKILPFILGAAVSPVLLVTTLYLLSLIDDPVKKALMFLLGGSITIGLITFLIFFTTNINPKPAPNKDLLPHLIIGVLLLFLAYGIYRRGPAKAHKEKAKKQGMLRYASLGFLLMVTNFTTIAMIFEVALEVRANQIIGTAKLLYLAATVLSSVLPILLPLLILFLAGKKSGLILKDLSGFMQKYSHVVTAVFFAVLGIYSIIKPLV